MHHPQPLPTSRHFPDPQHFADLERLGEEITELAAHIHATTFQLLELIRIFDEEQGWAGEGVNSCAHWLSWQCGMNQGTAREKVRVAHALSELPRISAAFREGRVSYSKVRAMTRAATRKNEEFLMHIARNGGDRYMVHIHTEADTLKADGESAESELEEHGCVSAETWSRWSNAIVTMV